MKRHPTMLRPSKPFLVSKVEEQAAFDATPAGAALVKFRRALMSAVKEEESAEGAGLHWTYCRGAEQELIAEIKRLQEKSDAEMERVKACEYIADGDEGWEVLRELCPSTSAVARLRDRWQLAVDEGRE